MKWFHSHQEYHVIIYYHFHHYVYHQVDEDSSIALLLILTLHIIINLNFISTVNNISYLFVNKNIYFFYSLIYFQGIFIMKKKGLEMNESYEKKLQGKNNVARKKYIIYYFKFSSHFQQNKNKLHSIFRIILSNIQN